MITRQALFGSLIIVIIIIMMLIIQQQRRNWLRGFMSMTIMIVLDEHDTDAAPTTTAFDEGGHDRRGRKSDRGEQLQ